MFWLRPLCVYQDVIIAICPTKLHVDLDAFENKSSPFLDEPLTTAAILLCTTRQLTTH